MKSFYSQALLLNKKHFQSLAFPLEAELSSIRVENDKKLLNREKKKMGIQ
jgi:hypothetical protein